MGGHHAFQDISTFNKSRMICGSQPNIDLNQPIFHGFRENFEAIVQKTDIPKPFRSSGF
jgi:hypothetical protein